MVDARRLLETNPYLSFSFGTTSIVTTANLKRLGLGSRLIFEL
jgi:hypothetical protein